MINLNQLRAFYYAAKYLNFSRAAQELFITQPAVTAQVKLLEKNLQLKLFGKMGGKIHLTEEGRSIYGYARRLFACEMEIEVAVEEIKNLRRGTLRIGTARTYARYFMPFLIARFREAYPGIRIQLDEGSSLEMTRNLKELRDELVVLSRREENAEIAFEPISREEVLLVLPPEHPFVRKGSVTFEEIHGEPIIVKEPGSGTRKLVDALFERNRCTPKVLMETSDAAMIKLLVQHGEGCSFLIREAVASEIAEGRLAVLPIQGERMFLDVSIGWLKNQPLSHPARAFLESLRTLGTQEMRLQGMGRLMAKMVSRGT